jgi:hypothetical protein
MKPCVCALIDQFRSRVGPDIFNAATLKATPFKDWTKTNLYIEGARFDMLPHLKNALWYAGTEFFFRQITDNQLLDAWLSKEKSHAETFKGFTSLRDAVEDPELLLLQIGILSYANRAMPGIFLETLKMRDHHNRATWILTPRHMPFQEGHLCYSVEGEQYMKHMGYMGLKVVGDNLYKIGDMHGHQAPSSQTPPKLQGVAKASPLQEMKKDPTNASKSILNNYTF